MKSVLITGHKGFIGSHLWRAFEKFNGVKLIGIDLKDGKDICECHLPKADLCFHLAAMVSVNSPNILDDAETNIYGTLRLLEHYRDKVVFASSSAINYPVNGYAIAKLAGEQYCRLYRAWIVRLCNIYGEGGHGVFEKFEQSQQLSITGDGKQIRTFAPVAKAVEALIETAMTEPGTLTIVGGVEMTINEIADLSFPDKPRSFTPRLPTDVLDGRQICQ